MKILAENAPSRPRINVRKLIDYETSQAKNAESEKHRGLFGGTFLTTFPLIRAPPLPRLPGDSGNSSPEWSATGSDTERVPTAASDYRRSDSPQSEFRHLHGPSYRGRQIDIASRGDRPAT